MNQIIALSLIGLFEMHVTYTYIWCCTEDRAHVLLELFVIPVDTRRVNVWGAAINYVRAWGIIETLHGICELRALHTQGRYPRYAFNETGLLDIFNILDNTHRGTYPQKYRFECENSFHICRGSINPMVFESESIKHNCLLHS